LRDPLTAVYGDDPRLEPALGGLLASIARAAATRPPELQALDHEREITPDWLQREQALGYVAYADRFAGTLAGVRERLPYLRELGVTYLHLMSLLRSRPEPNDGGYAVADYGEVEPALGTMDDLRALAGDLHDAGMALCVDVVVNHTAREHRWARWATFTPLEQAVQAGVARERGFRPSRESAVPDGRPFEWRGDYLVLAPYQHLWIAA
jgi:amylosucrase